MVAAFNNCNCAWPVIGLSPMFTTLALNSSLSPSLTKRGALGCTMISFWVITVLIAVPLDKSLVCARVISFHWVSASGMVKLNSMLPSLSVLSSGKKKAASFNFFLAFTSVKSCPFFNSPVLVLTVVFEAVSDFFVMGSPLTPCSSRRPSLTASGAFIDSCNSVPGDLPREVLYSL